jgi:hypothetical protein
MLATVCVILYGGFLYYLAIAQKWDLTVWFHRFKMGFIVDIWRRGIEGRVIVYVIFIVVLLGFQGLVFGFAGGPLSPEPPAKGEWVQRSDNTVVAGVRTTEGSSDVADPMLDDLNLVEANLTLSWNDNDVDEPIQPGPIGIAPENQPDTFRLVVTLPDETQYYDQAANDPDSRAGEIKLNVPMQQEGNITGWVIEVECLSAGDVVGVLGRVWATDDGNDWTLRVEYIHLEWVAPGDA